MSHVVLLFHRGCRLCACDSFAAFSRAPPCQSVRFYKISKLEVLELLQKVWGRSLHFLFGDDLFAFRLGASLSDAKGSFFLHRVGTEIVPTVHTKFVPTRHRQLFALALVHLIVANSAHPIGLERCFRVASVVDSALFQQLVRVGVKYFQQDFFAPVVLSQQDRRGCWRNVQDLRHFLQASLHFGYEVLGGEHSNTGFRFGACNRGGSVGVVGRGSHGIPIHGIIIFFYDVIFLVRIFVLVFSI
mmetsp:Transcript_1025/g.2632  ORF Transcript_1025/g.2632 Transcript_1025/m.2632 type:complete len:244 (+) Transcript_1025:931-1662(+)